jgi:hypothetical protein
MCLSDMISASPMTQGRRVALILDRFTRSLTVTFASNAASQILGMEPEHLKDRSFYDLIHHDCLDRATVGLEAVKTHDSIAYFRFHLKHPQQDVDLTDSIKSEWSTGEVWITSLGGLRSERHKRSTQEMEVEAMAFGSSDGLLVVMRRAVSPFIAMMPVVVY